IKQRLFADIERVAPATALLATNTSSLSIAQIAATMKQPGRLIGMHFFNPVHVMRLVEVVTHGREQGDGAAERAVEFARRLGMELGYNHPMGPLKLTDQVGLDVRLAIAEYLHATLGKPHYEPPKILREKVKKGELGRKTGKGFYTWSD